MSLRCGGGKEKEEELKKEGWIRQFVTDEPRLSEAVDLYRELGYEIHLEDATMDEVNQICANCLPADCRNYKIIFIRKST